MKILKFRQENLLLLLLLFLLLLPFNCLIAQETDEKKNSSSENQENPSQPIWEFLPMGIPYYTPDTSVSAALFTLFYKKEKGQSEDVKVSEFNVYTVYTLKNQLAIGTIYNYFPSASRWKFSGDVSFSRFPQLFWGMGASSRNGDEETYTIQSWTVRPSILRRIANKTYFGPLVNFIHSKVIESENGGIIDQNIYSGSQRIRILGLGFQFNYDSRDNVFSARSGFYFDLKNLYFREEWGSEFDFSRLEMDFRTFYTLAEKHTLALQVLQKYSSGDVPLLAQVDVGGSEMMRGILEGRYKEKNYIASQIEYRFPIYLEFSGALFSSVGQIASELGKFSSDDPITAWGFGFRYMVDKNDRVNIRFDIGFDENQKPNFYFLLKDAF